MGARFKESINYIDAEGFRKFGWNVQPAGVLSGTTNNFKLPQGSRFTIDAVGNYTITGFDSGPFFDGAEVTLTNIGTHSITIANQNSGSSTKNRVITGLLANVIVTPDTTITLRYDAKVSRWRMVGSPASSGGGGGGPFSDTAAFHQGGDTFGAPAVLGTQDSNTLAIITAGQQAMLVDVDQGIVIGSPTGGSKGVGTVNVQNGYYVNGTLFTGSDPTAYHSGDAILNPSGDQIQALGQPSLQLADIFSYSYECYGGPTEANAQVRLFSGGPNGGALAMGRGGSHPIAFQLEQTAVDGVAAIHAGGKLQQNAAPTTGDDLCNKTYVDAVASGGGWALGGNALTGNTAFGGASGDFDVLFLRNGFQVMQLEFEDEGGKDYHYLGFDRNTDEGQYVTCMQEQSQGIHAYVAMEFTNLDGGGGQYADCDLGITGHAFAHPSIPYLLADELFMTSNHTMALVGYKIRFLQRGLSDLTVAGEAFAITDGSDLIGPSTLTNGCMEFTRDGDVMAYMGATTSVEAFHGIPHTSLFSLSVGGAHNSIGTAGAGHLKLIANSLVCGDIYDDGSGTMEFDFIGGAGHYAWINVISNGAGKTGSGFAAVYQLTNSDGLHGWLTLAESGRGTTAPYTGGYVTMAADTGLGIKLNAGGTADNGLKIEADGGIVVGAATGGSKGAGTINVSGDVYKNGTPYTFPDYVFELWATGAISEFAENEGAKDYRLMSLDELEAYVRKHFRLPGIDDEAMGMFRRSNFLLEKVEELFLHLFDLRHQLQAA